METVCLPDIAVRKEADGPAMSTKKIAPQSGPGGRKQCHQLAHDIPQGPFLLLAAVSGQGQEISSCRRNCLRRPVEIVISDFYKSQQTRSKWFEVLKEETTIQAPHTRIFAGREPTIVCISLGAKHHPATLAMLQDQILKRLGIASWIWKMSSHAKLP